MRKPGCIGIVVGCLLAAVMTAEPKADFVLIANKGNRFEELSSYKVRMIFQRKISRWPWGAEIIAIDLPKQSPVRRSFTQQVLRSTIEDIVLYWIDQKVTNNLNPPLETGDALTARAIVANNPGAIAYVPAESVDSSVRVIKILD